MQRRTFITGAALFVLGACTNGGRIAGSSSTAPSMPLPSPRRSPGIGLDGALDRRRSIRSFADESLDEEAIAHLLWAAQGVTASWGGRTAPSAGALYPIEVSVATGEGLRRYVPEEGRTVVLTSEDRRPHIANATGGQDAALHAPALFVISGIVARTAEKYGDRAERYVQMEAGHVCQNLLLEAIGLGFGAVPLGAFSDDDLRTALGVDDDELPLYVVPVGHPAVEG
jgi:SagB-type dehydrogenase family enzyme